MQADSNRIISAQAEPKPLRQIADLPGPRAVPLLGNILQIRLPRIHQNVERWARQYGKFFRMHIGPMQVLVVADHAAVGHILRDRPDGFRRPAITSEIALEMGGLPGVFDSEGLQWRNQRRMVMPAFAPVTIKAYFPALVKVVLRLQGRWERAANAAQAIDLTADLKRYTVDIIAGLAFGTEVNTIDSDDDAIQQHLDNIFPALSRRSLSLLPYWRFFKLPVDRQLDRSVAAIQVAVNDFIAQARARLQADPSRIEHPRNMLEAMIVAADQNDSGVDDSGVAGNVLTMLLAGEDTTANTLAWILYLLQRNPHTLQRAQEEVRRVAPDPAHFNIEQMDALEYLDACAHEAMRLKPVAPFIPLQALRDSVVADIAVPKDSIVWCVLRHDSVDAQYFPKPLVFDPQRWLKAADGEASADKRIPLPFGAGARTCPGRYLALLEIKLALAMLLSRFEIERIDTEDGKEAEERMGFVMSPVGLQMRLRARK